LELKLSLNDVHAGYGSVRALHGVSIDVRQGETVALLGTNGNGKSTLMKCVMGEVRPTRGTITLQIEGAAHDLTRLPTQEIVNLGVAIVPEGRRLFPRLTVEENLVLGAYRPRARGLLAENLALCFDAFPVLKDRRKQLASSMSGGQQQMLAIARALMTSPKLLLIDEPSVGLAPILVTQAIDKINEMKKSCRLTVLMAEQNFQQAVRIADRGYVMVHGEIALNAQSVSELEDSGIVQELYLGRSGREIRIRKERFGVEAKVEQCTS
jgi:branched-chain amino acid transport system ATP-binding protein